MIKSITTGLLICLLSISMCFGQRIINQRLYQLGDIGAETANFKDGLVTIYYHQGRSTVTAANRTRRLGDFFQINTNLDSLNFVTLDSGSLAFNWSFALLPSKQQFLVSYRFPAPFAFDQYSEPCFSIYDAHLKRKIREIQYPGATFEDMIGTGIIFVNKPNDIWLYGSKLDTLTRWKVPCVRRIDTLFQLSPIKTYVDTGGFRASKIVKRGPNEYWLLGSQVYDTYTPGPNRYMAHGNKYILDSNGHFLGKTIFDFRDDSRGMRYSVRGATGLFLDYHPMPDKSWLVTGGMFSNPNYGGLISDSLGFIAKLDSSLTYTYWVQPLKNEGLIYTLEDNNYIRIGVAAPNLGDPAIIEIYRHDGATGAQLSNYSFYPVFYNLRPFPVQISPYTYTFIGDSSLLFTGTVFNYTNQQPRYLPNVIGAFTIKGIPNHFNPVGLVRKDQEHVRAQLTSYPNPFHASFRISPLTPSQYRSSGYLYLINTNGQVVYAAPYQMGDEVQAADLPTGLYFYQFASAQGVSKGRVMKE